jgi:hypothetical protein
MEMIYVENPAFFFKDIQLIWDGTVYHKVGASVHYDLGKQIGYAIDEYSTWNIYELKGYDHDYLVAVDKTVYRLMSSHAPEAPWRQYILDDATFFNMKSVTLFENGTAILAIPPISSTMWGSWEYTFENGELIVSSGDSYIARFDVIDENIIVFNESNFPIYTSKWARYVNTYHADG